VGAGDEVEQEQATTDEWVTDERRQHHTEQERCRGHKRSTPPCRVRAAPVPAAAAFTFVPACLSRSPTRCEWRRQPERPCFRETAHHQLGSMRSSLRRGILSALHRKEDVLAHGAVWITQWPPKFYDGRIWRMLDDGDHSDLLTFVGLIGAIATTVNAVTWAELGLQRPCARASKPCRGGDGPRRPLLRHPSRQERPVLDSAGQGAATGARSTGA
jgi:hypothetical protein